MTMRHRVEVESGRLLESLLSLGAWFLLLVSGYLYVAGVLCGRSNPLASGNGVQDFVVVVALSPLFFYLGPRHNWRPAEISARTILTWNGLSYVVPFFLALHWEYLGNALGAQFSLTGADLSALNPRSIMILALALAAIAGLLAYHLVWAHRARILRSYLAALLGIPCVVAVITLGLGDAAYLHVHHYSLGAYLFPFFRFRKIPSLVAQAFFLGLAVEGIARWGIDPMWYRVP